MKIFFKNLIFSCFICFVICALLSTPLFLEKNSKYIDVQKNTSNVQYFYTSSNIETNIILNITECPVLFSVEIKTQKGGCYVDCVPKSAIDMNIKPYDQQTTKEKASRYFKKDFQRIIAVNETNFKNIINYIGGITVDTPFGLPAPSNNGVTIAMGEKLRIYGTSVYNIIKSENLPTPQKMEYYNYLISEVFVKFLKNCNIEDYKFFKNRTNTNISYKDFYDNYILLNTTIKQGYFYLPKIKWNTTNKCWVNTN